MGSRTVPAADGVYNSPESMSYLSTTFEDFFHAHRDRLFGFLCVVTANRHDAEELAQEAFLRLWERWEASGSIDDPVGYLHRTAMNAFRKRLRRADVARRLTGRPVDRLAASPEDTVMLHETLRGLTPRQRAALALTEWLGYTAEEAARILGVKASTIGALKYQARAALKGRAEQTDD